MQYAIEIKNLCKQYPKFALQSVSFTLPMGYIMGFIGENGAGKTTLFTTVLICALAAFHVLVIAVETSPAA